LPLLAVRDLHTYFHTPSACVRAVSGIDLEIHQGETVGLIGESGCGKSTLGLSLLRLVQEPCRIERGAVFLEDRDLLRLSEEEMRRVRWREIAMIPQSAMNALNPVLTVGEQIAEAVRAHMGVGRQAAMGRAREMLDLVGIDPVRCSAYPHEFSGGMKQRVAIAMALSCEPKLVVSDEATTGLDVMTQAHVVGLLRSLQRKLGLAILFVSHDLPLVLDVSDRIAIMYAGKLVEVRRTSEIREQPLHPYTEGLMRAFPPLVGPRVMAESIPGAVPNLAALPAGCSFHPRCCHADPSMCEQQTPASVSLAGGGHVCCHRVSPEGLRESVANGGQKG